MSRYETYDDFFNKRFGKLYFYSFKNNYFKKYFSPEECIISSKELENLRGLCSYWKAKIYTFCEKRLTENQYDIIVVDGFTKLDALGYGIAVDENMYNEIIKVNEKFKDNNVSSSYSPKSNVLISDLVETYKFMGNNLGYKERYYICVPVLFYSFVINTIQKKSNSTEGEAEKIIFSWCKDNNFTCTDLIKNDNETLRANVFEELGKYLLN